MKEQLFKKNYLPKRSFGGIDRHLDGNSLHIYAIAYALLHLRYRHTADLICFQSRQITPVNTLSVTPVSDIVSPGLTPSGVVTFTNLISRGVGLSGYLLLAFWACMQLVHIITSTTWKLDESGKWWTTPCKSTQWILLYLKKMEIICIIRCYERTQRCLQILVYHIASHALVHPLGGNECVRH